jgi:hypothetical protein
MFWTIVIIVIVLFIILVIYGSKQIKGNEKKMTEKGFDISKRILSGKYIAGHPDLDESIQITTIFPKDDSLVIMEESGVNISVEKAIKAKIKNSEIKNIIVEDQSTIEKRITVGRLLAVGVFAFALKKKKKNEIAFVTIEWNDGKFDHETIFEFEGTDAMQKANTARNKMMKAVR